LLYIDFYEFFKDFSPFGITGFTAFAVLQGIRGSLLQLHALRLTTAAKSAIANFRVYSFFSKNSVENDRSSGPYRQVIVICIP
jgi:hypothetical protein